MKKYKRRPLEKNGGTSCHNDHFGDREPKKEKKEIVIWDGNAAKNCKVFKEK